MLFKDPDAKMNSRNSSELSTRKTICLFWKPDIVPFISNESYLIHHPFLCAQTSKKELHLVLNGSSFSCPIATNPTFSQTILPTSKSLFSTQHSLLNFWPLQFLNKTNKTLQSHYNKMTSSSFTADISTFSAGHKDFLVISQGTL